MPNLTLVRRFLVLQALMLWQGGFTFYAGVVVPVGTDVLGSAARQGAITGPVSFWLNLVGVVALALLAWDIAARPSAGRWWVWAAAAVMQWMQLLLREYTLFFMDPAGRRVLMPEPFRYAHATYLWTASVQWAVMLGLAWMTVAAWRAEDREGKAERGPRG